MKAGIPFLLLILLSAGCGEAYTAPEAPSRLLTGTAPVSLAVRGRPETQAESPEAPELDLPPVDPDRALHIRDDHEAEIVDEDGVARLRVSPAWLNASLAAAGKTGRVQLHAPSDVTWARVHRMLDHAVPSDRDSSTRLALAIHGGPKLELDVRRMHPRPRIAFGLTLSLEPSKTTRIEAQGNGWVRAWGCEAELVETIEGWGPDAASLWADRLNDLLRFSADEGEDYEVLVEAASDVRLADIAPFLAAATDRDVAPLDLGIRPDRRRFDDVVDNVSCWLAAHQLPNGGWHETYSPHFCDGKPFRDADVPKSPDADAALTARALLAFLGAGYTNRGKHPYARVVGRGMRVLKSCQHPDGSFQLPGGVDLLRDAWCTLALTEIYGMTGSPIYKGAAQRGLENLTTSWWSGAPAMTTAVVAAAVCSAQLINKDALARGKTVRLVVDGTLAGRLHQDAKDVDATRADQEAASALFARCVLGENLTADAIALTGLLSLRRHMKLAGRATDPILAYFTAVATYHSSGKHWEAVKKLLDTDAFMGAQTRRGAWCCAKGSVDPREGTGNGRVAATALYAVIYQLFYRYDRVFGSR